MVEFAITLALFMVVLLAIFEFVLMIMAFSRANEATRDIARSAILRVPTTIVALPGDGSIDGDDYYEALASRQLRPEWVDNIQISYEALPDSPGTYTVTVGLEGAEYPLFAPTLLGLSPTIGVPSFTTSRLSENLDIE
ncbi:MAG: TadE/TadG family type IV pilus assembly protein [Pseudomonadota bacterium]